MHHYMNGSSINATKSLNLPPSSLFHLHINHINTPKFHTFNISLPLALLTTRRHSSIRRQRSRILTAKGCGVRGESIEIWMYERRFIKASRMDRFRVWRSLWWADRSFVFVESILLALLPWRIYQCKNFLNRDRFIITLQNIKRPTILLGAL